MTVKTLLKRLRKDDLFGKRVRIKKINPSVRGRCFLEFDRETSLEGLTGVLTNRFSGFDVEGIGIFLDGINPDACNLDITDEVEFID